MIVKNISLIVLNVLFYLQAPNPGLIQLLLLAGIIFVIYKVIKAVKGSK